MTAVRKGYALPPDSSIIRRAVPAHPTPERFGRYRVVDLLGAGANGLVYRVEDPETDAQVALKVLRSGLGQAADLKREFRLVADLTHRNLVLPYALESEGDEVFFTMELVVGKPIVAGLPRGAGGERDWPAVRDAFRQLAEGVLALHDRRLLHRDIKPSNVLVEPSGRVAILDFGLVRHIDRPLDAGRRYFAGSPGYLAPEIFSGGAASAASDAYAAGVVLHELLTGGWPYDRDVRESVVARMLAESPPVVDEGPDDLAGICRGLLHPDPARRLTLEDAHAELAERPRASRRPSVASSGVVGRDDERACLHNAWNRVREQGRPAVVHVPGPSGMGKSALLRSFARDLDARAWVLEGRAYERDTVPFKAIDAAIDQLARRIAALTADERERLLPEHPADLDTIFPALGAAFQIARVDDGASVARDPNARRRSGVRALAELLARVAEQHGLVLVLDDLQWGDLDSARLLVDLLTSPAPAMLVALSYRPGVSPPFLSVVERGDVADLATETVAVGPLPPSSALQLARSICDDEARAAAVARESEGCPFLIEMLASTPHEAALTFDAALELRLAALSTAARQMLGAVCVAARPVARRHVPFAPESVTDARAAWALLASERLLLSHGSTVDALVEPYHDRIRDAVTRALSPDDRRSSHLALGESFASAGDADGAATHLAAAGDRRRAFGFAESAAAGAVASLAFERAAQLLALALECAPPDPALRRDLTLRRAHALADAGRGPEAAPLFLETAAGRADTEGLDLRRRAMEQYFVGGRLDEGRPLMNALLADLGIWLPRREWLVNAVLYAEVGRLLLRGPRLRRSRAISARERLVLDTFGSIGKGLTSCDASLGSWFFLRAGRLALDWGEPQLAVRGITYMASLLGFSGAPSAVARAERWIDAGERIARDRSDEHALAFCQVGRGMVACCTGQWARAIQMFDGAAAVLDARFAGSDWEANLAKGTSLFALVQTGDIAELEVRAGALTQEARERGDLGLEVESNLYLSFAALARDSADEAHRCVERNRRLWTIRGYHFQHWIALRFATLASLYEGAFETALARIDEELVRARRANLTAMQVVRIEAHDLHGRAALGVAAKARGAERRRALASVEEDIARLSKESRPHAHAPAEMLRAGLARASGDHVHARARLLAAAAAYGEAGMETHALAARWHAELGRAEIERALVERGVVNPQRWARMHWPTAEA